MSDKLADGLSGVFTPCKTSDVKAEALGHLREVVGISKDINLLIMKMATDAHVAILHSPKLTKHLELMDEQLEAIRNLEEAIERL